jgi:hypothetical protein
LNDISHITEAFMSFRSQAATHKDDSEKDVLLALFRIVLDAYCVINGRILEQDPPKGIHINRENFFKSFSLGRIDL